MDFRIFTFSKTDKIALDMKTVLNSKYICKFRNKMVSTDGISQHSQLLD